MAQPELAVEVRERGKAALGSDHRHGLVGLAQPHADNSVLVFERLRADGRLLWLPPGAALVQAIQT